MTKTRDKIQIKRIYIDLLEDDTGYAVNEVEYSMQDRHLWRAIISAQQQESMEWVAVWSNNLSLSTNDTHAQWRAQVTWSENGLGKHQTMSSLPPMWYFVTSY